MKKQYMAIDQYGQTYHGLEHPRKDLMNKLCCQHADRVYVDSADGKTYHVGYVIAGRWLNVYEVIPLRKPIR